MKVIITGTTWMVWEGVLLECLSNSKITKVLSVTRKSLNIKHPKLEEYIVTNFLNLKENDSKLKDYDACFFCAWVSSAWLSEKTYSLLTYDTTLAFWKALNPKSKMIFTYVSWAWTDSSEKKWAMWAKVKWKTENDLMKLWFKKVYWFRPGLMKISQNQKNPKWIQKFMSFLYPVFKLLFPNHANTVSELWKAMISLLEKDYEKNIIEVKDIIFLAKNK